MCYEGFFYISQVNIYLYTMCICVTCVRDIVRINKAISVGVYHFPIQTVPVNLPGITTTRVYAYGLSAPRGQPSLPNLIRVLCTYAPPDSRKYPATSIFTFSHFSCFFSFCKIIPAVALLKKKNIYIYILQNTKNKMNLFMIYKLYNNFFSSNES